VNTRLPVKSARLCIGLLVAAACLPALRTKSDEPAKAEEPAADSMLGREAGGVRDDNELKMKLVWCPPGFLTLESIDAEKSLVRGFVQAFWLGKYEVTRGEWRQMMGTEPWTGKTEVKNGDDCPVTHVRWTDAMEFCRKLTEGERNARRLTEGWEYTLPTDAQWERACRAKTETTFSFGDDASQLGEYAWYATNTLAAGEAYAHPVGGKKPNPWGLYDMHGNAWEWTRDAHAAKLPGGRDPEVLHGSRRVLRGGSFAHESERCRTSDRRYAAEDIASPFVGFRVALRIVPPAK